MLRLVGCVVGIYICFLTWGITQERVTTTLYDGKKFNLFIVLNLFQSIAAFIVAWLYLKSQGKSLDFFRKDILKSFFWLSILGTCHPGSLSLLSHLTGTIASPFGYASLKHIDYPTLILGKSCKLVPVMIMNFFLYRKTFPSYKYAAVALITAGVSAFMLLHPQESKKSTQNSAYGIALLSLNLFIDGATNSTQDQIFRKHKTDGMSMMVMMNLFSSVFMFAYLWVGPYLPSPLTSTEFSQAQLFLITHPAVLYDIMLFGICGALGQCFIFYTLEKYGAVVLVTVTVTRKMFSMLLSAFWFNHVFSLGQWGAVMTVFSGISLEAYMKHMEKQKSVPAQKTKKKLN